MFRYRDVKFVTSVAPGCPLHESELPEIAVAGKSNVGKSSFINLLADNGKLAKTSNTPGRTRLVNYFSFGCFMLVDLPGYGFAKVEKAQQAKWGEMIEGYLLNSRRLKRILLLLDSRHPPTELDIVMINFMYQYTLPFNIVLTKADKLSRSQLTANRESIARAVRMTPNDVYVVSAQTKAGRDEVVSLINRVVGEG